MKNMQIGFSQRIQLEWLEYTARLFLEEASRQDIESTLKDYLRDRLSVGGNAKRGNREKAISILLKIWVTVPKGLKAFRDDGHAIFKGTAADDHLPIHWGMSMAVYPFFGIVARTVGRLIKLQGSASAYQVQRRIREQLGERETVARAARRILSCFRDWGVLLDTDKKGIYRPAPQQKILGKNLKSWLIEAALLSNGAKTMPLKSLLEKPEFFPFSIEQVTLRDVERNPRLSTFRHGLDEDMAMLRDCR